MKKICLLIATLIFSVMAYCQYSLLEKPMPVLPSKTLDGKTIDENYFKGHITVVSFMFIGCLPCMNEINVLNKLRDEYKGDTLVQFLCVARQMREQMIQFNEDSTSLFGRLRKALQAQPIRYTIQPGCEDAQSKIEKSGTDSVQEVHVKSECNTLTEVYGSDAFPFMFFVDQKGIVKRIDVGGPPMPNDPQFHDKVKTQIETMLAERAKQ